MAVFEDTLAAMLGSAHLVVRSVAARMQASLDTEEGLNLLSNLTKGTEIWSAGRVLGRLARRSDFNLETDIFACCSGEHANATFQHLGQLQAVYRKWRSLLAIASCQVALGINDEETAELFSKMIGDRTVEIRSVGVNTGASTVLAHHQNAGVGEASRRLMQASEILRMDRREALVFMRGLPHPVRATRVEYFNEAVFAGIWDRWRSEPAVPLTLEHKVLAVGVKR